MAEEEEASKGDHSLSKSPRPPPFLEVICKSSGKVRRFAAGTEAGFALSLINQKLDVGNPIALHIEAIKEGEEPVNFGPNSVLVDYGNGWKLQTVTEEGAGNRAPSVQVICFMDSVQTTECQSVALTDLVSFLKVGIMKGEGFRPMMRIPTITSSDGSHPGKRASLQVSSFGYIGRIFLALILIFLLGAIFTLLLENLPRLILYINSM